MKLSEQNKILRRGLVDALCLLASTVFTDDRIVTKDQRNERRKLMMLANRHSKLLRP